MKIMYPILLLCVGCAAVPPHDPWNDLTPDQLRCEQDKIEMSLADSASASYVKARYAKVDSLFCDSVFKQNLDQTTKDSKQILSYLKEIR